MSLIKPLALTPRKLAANRANARKSTGPRTPDGKARASLNGMRHGRRSKGLQTFMLTLIEAPVGCDVRELASRLLPPAYLADPAYQEVIEFCRMVIEGPSELKRRGRPRKIEFQPNPRSRLESTGFFENSAGKPRKATKLLKRGYFLAESHQPTDLQPDSLKSERDFGLSEGTQPDYEVEF